MRPIREPKAKSRDELRVSPITTSRLLIERIPPTSIAVYTDTSSNLEEAHWRKHSTATYTYGGGSAYEGSTPSPGTKLPRKIIAWRKRTYGRDLYNSADLLR